MSNLCNKNDGRVCGLYAMLLKLKQLYLREFLIIIHTVNQLFLLFNRTLTSFISKTLTQFKKNMD